MGNIITESGIDFIADNTFHIERSLLYTDTLSGKGIRTVEFIRVKDNSLIFVEAKSSFPKPDDDPNVMEHGQFEVGINEICEKFIHSLNLYSSVKIGVTEPQFPKDFIAPDKISLEFVLVVKNHEFKWCRSIKAALKGVIPSYINKIWRPKVNVINHNTAIKYKLAVIREGNVNG